MFGHKRDDEIVPKGSALKSLKRLILVACLFFAGGLLILGSYELVQLTEQMVMYIGVGLLGLAALYHFLY